MTAPNVWRRACNSSNCVQVRRAGDRVEVRDSFGTVRSIVASEFARLMQDIPDRSLAWTMDRFAAMGLTYTFPEINAFRAGVRAGRFDALTAEWPTVETSSAALADVDPDSGTHSTPQPVSVELSADSGPVVSDVHPAVQAVIDIYRAAIKSGDGPEDLAARYAAAVLRWAAFDIDDGCHPDEPCDVKAVMRKLRALADEIDPPKETR